MVDPTINQEIIIDKLVSITRSSEFLLKCFNDTDVHYRLHSIAADAYHILHDVVNKEVEK